MKKVFGFIVIAAVALSMASCFSSKKGSAANGGEVTGVGGTNFAEPSPYGIAHILLICAVLLNCDLPIISNGMSLVKLFFFISKSIIPFVASTTRSASPSSGGI